MRTLAALIIPIVAQGMHPIVVPGPVIGASAASVMMAGASVLWYSTMSTAGLSALKAVPEIVEVAADGVEDIVNEVSDGARLIVRGMSYGILALGLLFLLVVLIVCPRWTYYRTRRARAPHDPFTAVYGGRLLGGMDMRRTPPENELVTCSPVDRVSLTDMSLAKARLRATGITAAEVAKVSRPTPPPLEDGFVVDLSRLEVNDHFAFISNKGSRHGQWRHAQLIDKVHEARSRPS